MNSIKPWNKRKIANGKTKNYIKFNRKMKNNRIIIKKLKMDQPNLKMKEKELQQNLPIIRRVQKERIKDTRLI